MMYLLLVLQNKIRSYLPPVFGSVGGGRLLDGTSDGDAIVVALAAIGLGVGLEAVS